MQQNFQTLLDTLQDSIITWDYFVDFEKVQKNIKKIERELALLNTLIGKDNIETEFLDLVKEYPKVRKILPILIAVRREKMNNTLIKKHLLDWNPEEKNYLFYKDLTIESEKELLLFFNESGLKGVFQNKIDLINKKMTLLDTHRELRINWNND